MRHHRYKLCVPFSYIITSSPLMHDLHINILGVSKEDLIISISDMIISHKNKQIFSQYHCSRLIPNPYM